VNARPASVDHEAASPCVAYILSMKKESRSARGAAIALFLLSPFVAEFLLGTIAIDQLAAGLVLAPLYGGGALLVREVGRRSTGGWRAILLLAFAYAVIEEGVVVQTLFNPRYLGLDLLRDAYVPWLGIGAWWSLFVLTLHTVWSMAVPIALAEAFSDRARQPWLGRIGLIVSGLLFLLGTCLTAYFTYAQERFLASGFQLGGALLVALAGVAAAWRVRHGKPIAPGRVPPEWTLGLLSFAASGAFMLARRFTGGWTIVGVYVLLFAAVGASVAAWSLRADWTDRHVLALAGGALLTYAWHAFVQEPVVGGAGPLDHVGDAVFSLLAAGVLWLAMRRARRSDPLG
jgi:hypothetical protein